MPIEGHNTAEFMLKPESETTNVTWAMYGPNHFLGKVMSIFFDVDYTAPAYKSDLHAGGKYLYSVRSSEGQNFWSTGVIAKSRQK